MPSGLRAEAALVALLVVGAVLAVEHAVQAFLVVARTGLRATLQVSRQASLVAVAVGVVVLLAVLDEAPLALVRRLLVSGRELVFPRLPAGAGLELLDQARMGLVAVLALGDMPPGLVGGALTLLLVAVAHLVRSSGLIMRSCPMCEDRSTMMARPSGSARCRRPYFRGEANANDPARGCARRTLCDRTRARPRRDGDRLPGSGAQARAAGGDQ